MNAGFARVDMTPPLGTPMMGVGISMARLSQTVHDPLYVRALYVEHDGEPALIVGFDLCFISRDIADRFKGALARTTGLHPRSVLLNASHTHAGPAVGVYFDMRFAPPPADFYDQLEAATVKAAQGAIATARPARLKAGASRSNIPVSRRLWRNNQIDAAPNLNGVVHDALPMCLFEDNSGRPICLLFSISTHPVAARGTDMTADYPGFAMHRIDAYLGAPCSLFVQGTAGDSRPRQLIQVEEWNWKSTIADAEATGEVLAQEVIAGLERLRPSDRLHVRSAIVDTRWPIQVPSRAEIEAERKKYHGDLTTVDGLRGAIVELQLKLLDQGRLPTSIPVMFQAVQLAEDIRIVAMQGEPVAAHGNTIDAAFPAGGTTFALGYTNGDAAYLPTSQMLDEGGYETNSLWEFAYPGTFAKGIEQIIQDALSKLKSAGVR